jgi:3D (Asp-Asp-Asp) domain-containing protein
MIRRTSAASRAHQLLVAAALVVTGCASGKDWVRQLPGEHDPVPEPGWNAAPPPERLTDDPTYDGNPRASVEVSTTRSPTPPPEFDSATREEIAVVATDDLFRNTYYDFPREAAGKKESTIFDAQCAPIAQVPKAFHDQVCVQGSGRLATGSTVSFAKRNCSCAAMCPRTGQQICFERLDPARFPSGRGATGKAITPFRTVAVDSNVIPLGTSVFIPEFVGLPRPDGKPHDGCFVAEDRGLRVVGRQVDVFMGDPASTVVWNKLFPSNRGVHVRVNEPRCRHVAGM